MMVRWMVAAALVDVVWLAAHGATDVRAVAPRPARPEIDGGFISGTEPVVRTPAPTPAPTPTAPAVTPTPVLAPAGEPVRTDIFFDQKWRTSSAAVAVDGAGGIHIAYFPAALEDGGGEQLYYGLCNADCTQAESWRRANLNLGDGHGGDPDLVFDPDGFPAIAYIAHDGAALGFAECLAACESVAAEWGTILLDSNTELEEDWPVPLAPTCDGGLWNFWTPSVAYDAAGNLRIVTDVTYYGNGICAQQPCLKSSISPTHACKG